MANEVFTASKKHMRLKILQQSRAAGAAVRRRMPSIQEPQNAMMAEARKGNRLAAIPGGLFAGKNR
jgi:hypothetical protein